MLQVSRVVVVNPMTQDNETKKFLINPKFNKERVVDHSLAQPRKT